MLVRITLVPELHERIYVWLCKKSKGSATGKLRCSGILDKLRTDVLNDPVALRRRSSSFGASNLSITPPDNTESRSVAS